MIHTAEPGASAACARGSRHRSARAPVAMMMAIAVVVSLASACAPDGPGPKWMTLGPSDKYEIGTVYLANPQGPSYRGGPPPKPVRVAVVRPPDGTPTVLSLIDPHQGCRVGWRPSEQLFVNPCHGQMYDWTGRCVSNCRMDLSRYPVRLDDDGTLLVDMAPTPTSPVPMAP